MIRQGQASDMDELLCAFEEHFDFEEAHPEEKFTVFERGHYPSQKTVEKALSGDYLYVYEEDGEVLGLLILYPTSPKEYQEVPWQIEAQDEELYIIELLMVRPKASGRGIAKQLLGYIDEMGRANGKKAIRLDTGHQNTKACMLYQKVGYRIAWMGYMTIGGEIPHPGHLFLEKIL